MQIKSILYGCAVAAAVTLGGAASAMPIASPTTKAIATPPAAVQAEKVYLRCYRFGRCYRYGGYRYRYRYAYRPVIRLRVPFVRLRVF